MQWIVAVTVPIAVVLLVFAAARNLVARRARNIREKMERRYGESIRLIAGCGIVGQANRVPGVLVLADSLLAYEAILAGGAGEIELSSVKSYDFEDTAETKHGRARKYLRAKVLALYTGGPKPKLFVIPAARAEDWRAGLQEALGEPVGA
jgi:hypothetical protein